MTFANAQITNDGSDNFYEADILIASTEDFYVGSGQVYFDYNTVAFGENISSNNAIEYSQPTGSILGFSFGMFSPAYKDFIQNDNIASRVSLSFQQNVAESGLATAPEIQITSTPKVLFHIKIKYIDAGENANVCFYNDTVFQDQFFTACGGITTADCTGSPGEQITDDTYDCSEAEVDTLNVETFDTLISTLNVYPNPTKNYISVDSNELIRHIMLYNLLGELIIKESNISMLDLSYLSNGVYLLKIILDHGNEVTKKIIKH